MNLLKIIKHLRITSSVNFHITLTDFIKQQQQNLNTFQKHCNTFLNTLRHRMQISMHRKSSQKFLEIVIKINCIVIKCKQTKTKKCTKTIHIDFPSLIIHYIFY